MTSGVGVRVELEALNLGIACLDFVTAVLSRDLAQVAVAHGFQRWSMSRMASGTARGTADYAGWAGTRLNPRQTECQSSAYGKSDEGTVCFAAEFLHAETSLNNAPVNRDGLPSCIGARFERTDLNAKLKAAFFTKIV